MRTCGLDGTDSVQLARLHGVERARVDGGRPTGCGGKRLLRAIDARARGDLAAIVAQQREGLTEEARRVRRAARQLGAVRDRVPRVVEGGLRHLLG